MPLVQTSFQSTITLMALTSIYMVKMFAKED